MKRSNLYLTFGSITDMNGTYYWPPDTKNPPQTILRGIFVEHRGFEPLTYRLRTYRSTS